MTDIPDAGGGLYRDDLMSTVSTPVKALSGTVIFPHKNHQTEYGDHSDHVQRV
jgi:hypothetical protein